MKIYSYLLLLFLTIPLAGNAQRVINVRAEAKGNVVFITYDLVGTIRGQTYDVEIYGSHNGKIKPLTHVRGDLGKNLSPGRKVIEWGAKKELKDYEGNITLEVRATLTYSPIRVTAPRSDDKHRRGKSYTIEWLGATDREDLLMELYTDSLKVRTIGQSPNKRKYTWEIPMDIKPGENYRIKMSSVSKPANSAFSARFAIRRKIPTVAKVVPAGLLSAGIIYWLINLSPPPPSLGEDLPLPPGPQ